MMDALLEGTFSKYIQQLSNEEVYMKDLYGRNLLMQICTYNFDNMEQMDAFLRVLPLFDVNEFDENGCNAAYYAAPLSARKLEVLCALGIDTEKKQDRGWMTPFERALTFTNYASAKVLIANGSRTKNISIAIPNFKTQLLLDFEKGIISCRNVIVILLGLKKYRRVAMLPKLDRFLVKQILAVEIWSTRSCDNEKWRK